MAASVPWRFAGTGTSSNRISASPSIVAWQARTRSPSWLPWGSTSPDTTRTRQVSHCPEQQSWGISMRAASPASTRVSPRLTRSCLPLTVRVHLSPMINRLSQIEGCRRVRIQKGTLPMAAQCMTTFTGRMWRVWRVWLWSKTETHMNTSLARDEVDVVLAAGRDVAAELEGPVAVLPLGPAEEVGPVAFVVAHDEDAGEHGADRDLVVELLRVRDRFGLGHPPARILVVAALRIGLEAAARRDRGIEVLGQAQERRRPAVADIHFVVVAVEGPAGIVPVAGLVARLAGSFARGRLARWAEILVVDAPEMAAARGLPLPNVDEAAVGRVVQAAR